MQRDIIKLRKWCIRRYNEDVPATRICALAQIPRRTFYNWLEKYNALNTVENLSKAPHTVHRVPDTIINKVIEIRKLSNRSEYAIASYLNRQSISISHSTVYRILKKSNLINALTKPRHQRTYKRFSRKHSNSLWQTDLTLFGNRCVAAFLDDHSRFLTGIDFIPKASAESVMSVFGQAIDAFGKPREILTDHGTQYYDVHGGISDFTQFCNDNKIKHIMGSIGHPQTTGKIERFFMTFKEEYEVFNSLDEFVDYYNNKRLHGAIGYLTPAEVYYDK